MKIIGWGIIHPDFGDGLLFKTEQDAKDWVKNNGLDGEYPLIVPVVEAEITEV